MTLEIEYNQNQQHLNFKQLENVTIGLSIGDPGHEVDIELLKPGLNIEQDSTTNTMLWHVPNLHEQESAVLSFASKAIVFDEMFPLEVRFNEQYSLIDLNIQGVPRDALTGEEMTKKISNVMCNESYKITNE